MKDRNMITIRNKKTGKEITVPRSQYIEEKPSSGVDAVMQDLKQSWDSAPRALGEMALSIPGGINNVGGYATSHNPVETFGNLGAGGVESGAALLSSPQQLMRYIAEKFPNAGKAMERGKFQGKGVNDPSIYESLMDFENQHGLAARSPQEASVRNAGGLMFGGKALSMLPNMFARAGTLGAEQAGRGGDPLHAAILGILGESAGKIPVRRAKELPRAMMDMMQAVPEKVKQIPELTANMGQSMGDPLSVAFQGLPSYTNKMLAHGLESLAEKTDKIPFRPDILPEKLLEMAYKKKFKEYKPEELARKQVFSDITGEDIPQIEKRVAAARRLGLSFLTPGEALLSPFQSRKEANVGHSIKGEKLLYSKGSNRAGSEQRAIENLLDTIYDKKELSPEKKAAYDSAMESHVPQEFIDKWLQNENVKKAIKQMESESEYKQELGNTPKTSFRYWDHVKKVLADIEKGHMKPGSTKKFKLGSVTKTRNQMVDEMDNINSKYESARNISEREFTRNDLENVFDSKDMTINNFWSLLKSEKKFNDLMKKLDEFPEAQQKLRDIRLLSNDLIPFDESIRSAYKLEKTGMYKERNKLDSLRRVLTQQHGEAHDVAQVNLMTDPRMLELLKEYLSKGKK